MAPTCAFFIVHLALLALARQVSQPPRALQCSPPAAEQAGLRAYGFAGVHYVRQLRAWFYEVPKSASTTITRFFKLSQGRGLSKWRERRSPLDIGFTLVRHPVCRAISAFHTAHGRAAWRTNRTNSPCPFSRFPYLRENISDSEGLVLAVRTLRAHGTGLADSACGFAYHHLLSQAWFLWRPRVRLLLSRRGAKAPPAESELPPPPTVVLRLESLAQDLLALCAARNASAYCSARMRALGGLQRANPSRRASVNAEALAAIQDYYSPDYECLGYAPDTAPGGAAGRAAPGDSARRAGGARGAATGVPSAGAMAPTACT